MSLNWYLEAVILKRKLQKKSKNDTLSVCSVLCISKLELMSVQATSHNFVRLRL